MRMEQKLIESAIEMLAHIECNSDLESTLQMRRNAKEVIIEMRNRYGVEELCQHFNPKKMDIVLCVQN